MLSVKQVAERLNAGASSVRLWARNGKFKGAEYIELPLGAGGSGYWLIPETALEGFEVKGRGRPPKPKPEEQGSGKAKKKR